MRALIVVAAVAGAAVAGTEKLPHDEQLKLARRTLQATALSGGDTEAYRAAPVSEDEFGGEDAAASWEAEGWEEFYESR